MRAERASSFYINNDGIASVEYEGQTHVLGRVGIDAIEPDLLHGERVLAARWHETSDFLRTHHLRHKVHLVAEREPIYQYGFLWLSFSFDRGRARKRWGRGLDLKSLDQASETLADAIPAKTYPDYHGRIEKEGTRWVFHIEIVDEDPAEKFFKVFFRALDKKPVLREYLMPA